MTKPKQVELPFVRSAYNYDREAASDECAIRCTDPSLAQQHQKEEADINTIVKRFGLTGQLPQNVRVPLEDDFFDAMTFHEAQNALVAAQESFMKMPAAVRARFDNDPGAFVEFCSDRDNLDEMRSMGLAVDAIEAQEGRSSRAPTPGEGEKEGA